MLRLQIYVIPFVFIFFLLIVYSLFLFHHQNLQKTSKSLPLNLDPTSSQSRSRVLTSLPNTPHSTIKSHPVESSSSQQSTKALTQVVPVCLLQTTFNWNIQFLIISIYVSTLLPFYITFTISHTNRIKSQIMLTKTHQKRNKI